MHELPWCSPLVVRLQSGVERKFAGPYDALYFLDHEWPVRGFHHARARQECRLALQGRAPADQARESFLAACLEAGLELPASRRRQAA